MRSRLQASDRAGADAAGVFYQGTVTVHFIDDGRALL
jgi:hypothetical protein